MQEIPNYLSKLDDKLIICDVSTILKDTHKKTGLSYRQAGKIIGITEWTYAKNLNSNRSSIGFLKKFTNGIDSLTFEKIYLQEKITITAKKKLIPLPKQVDSNLAYFFGYLQGDGCLVKDGIRLTFTDEYIEQLESINALSKKIFGITGAISLFSSEISTKPCPRLHIKSVVMNSFFHVVLGLNRGKKKDMTIPLLIRHDKNLLSHYIAGLFDADGTIPKNPETAKQLFLDITMRDQSFIEDIKLALKEFGIDTLKTFERITKSPSSDFISKTYEIRIRRKAMILKFLQEIGSYHPNKRKRAERIIQMIGPVA